jgi:hypothetical protein
MTKYLISFPASAMAAHDQDALQAASVASHEVVRQAKDAGVWVFGGGIDDAVPPVVVDGDGTLHEGAPAHATNLDGGYAVLELPKRGDALEWAARLARACGCPQEVRAFGDDPES